MSTVPDLMGLGMPGALANRLGNTPTVLAGVGTSQTGAAAISTAVTVGTTSSGQTAFILPSGASLGRPFFFFNTTATTALVYPPSGGTINLGSTNASVSVAQNTGMEFMLLVNNGSTTQEWGALTAGTSGSAGSFTTLAASGATTLSSTLAVAGLATFIGIGSTVPWQVYNTASNTTGFTATGANICGGTSKVFLNLTGTLGGGASIQLPTVSALVTAMGVAGLNPQIGSSYEIDVINTSSANFAWTITTNTGWTLTGTMTAAQNTLRRGIITFTTLSAAVFQSVGGYALTAV